jgi:hypothetical protein
MKHLKSFGKLNESDDYAVVFDGTSAYICDRDEVEDDVEVIDYFDDMDEA